MGIDYCLSMMLIRRHSNPGAVPMLLRKVGGCTYHAAWSSLEPARCSILPGTRRSERGTQGTSNTEFGAFLVRELRCGTEFHSFALLRSTTRVK